MTSELKPSPVTQKAMEREKVTTPSKWLGSALLGGVLSGGLVLAVLKYGQYTKRPWYYRAQVDSGRGFLFAALISCIGFYAGSQLPHLLTIREEKEEKSKYAT